MSRIIKVTNGDYHIVVENGGNIIYDTTLGGNVIINGNLDVKGTTSTIESTNLNVGVNLFSINSGLITAGIPAALNYESGMSIGRGTFNSAELIFSEQVTYYDPTTTLTVIGATGSGVTVTLTFTSQSNIPYIVGSSIVVAGFTPSVYNGTYTVTGAGTNSVSFANTTTASVSVYGTITANTAGTFLLRTANTNVTPSTNKILNGLQIRTLTSDGQNTLTVDMQRGTPTLRLANSVTSGGVPYYQRVLSKDDIPNVEWVQTYIASNYVLGSNTPGTATVQTIQQPVGVAIGSANSAIQATSTGLLFQVSGSTIATVSSAGTLLGNILVGSVANPDQIYDSVNNLQLTAANNNVEVAGSFYLNNRINSVTGTVATASGGTATITFALQFTRPFGIGSIIVVSGFTPSNFNGTYIVTGCTTTSVSYALSGTLTATIFGTVTHTISYTQSSTTTISTGTLTSNGSGSFTIATIQPAGTFYVGQIVTVTGTISGVTWTGYTTGNTYTISATDSASTFTLTTTGGSAISVTNGTVTGLTLTVNLANKTKLYATSTVGPGKTGIYFANLNGSQTPDELISRNRAVLLSILL